MDTIEQNLSKLINTLNDKRVITEEEVQGILTAIITILGENKKSVEFISEETKTQLKQSLAYIQGEHKTLLQSVRGDFIQSKSEIDQRVKDQNNRAFKRLSMLISAIKMPKDGKDGKDAIGIQGEAGKDGSPDSPVEVRDKLESLTKDERLDASAIKGLPDYIKTAKKAGKDMLVGGIRFFENLADVSILNKRADLLAQYNTTNNRWQNGVALTVSTTAPTAPQENDVWIDTN